MKTKTATPLEAIFARILLGVKAKEYADTPSEAIFARILLGVKAKEYAEMDTEEAFAALEDASFEYSKHWGPAKEVSRITAEKEANNMASATEDSLARLVKRQMEEIQKLTEQRNALLSKLKEVVRSADMTEPGKVFVPEFIESCCAVIAKAEGEQP